MTLKEALDWRWMRASELIRQTGISSPTIYNMTSETYKGGKTGVKTETLAKIAKALNAKIVIDENKPYYYDIILKNKKVKK